MALKDVDVGVKIIAGLGVVALVLAMASNHDPDNDAWGAGEAADASEASIDDDPALDEDDPWSAGADDDGGLPTCDGTAPFAASGGTVRLPVHGPVTPFASTACQMDGDGGEEAVRLLQLAVNACNDQTVAVDGDYGDETRRAVRAIQERGGTTPDGIYGPRTRDVMSWPLETGDPDTGDPGCGAPTGS